MRAGFNFNEAPPQTDERGRSEDRFRLLPNVLVIGTINMADRWIALPHMAIRRRFHFVDLVPERPPLTGC
jgi:5-methylcytosine-specific restriction endonuclease McrBC GTP-binding regulatory subunit McrB